MVRQLATSTPNDEHRTPNRLDENGPNKPKRRTNATSQMEQKATNFQYHLNTNANDVNKWPMNIQWILTTAFSSQTDAETFTKDAICSCVYSMCDGAFVRNRLICHSWFGVSLFRVCVRACVYAICFSLCACACEFGSRL